MALSSNKELAENKLILLYIISKIGMPISNLHLTKLVLENKFMNYFLLQQYLNELKESNFIKADEDESRVIYSITESGLQTLSFFHNLVPAGIKSVIDNSLSDIKRSIKNETLITADFIEERENEFLVECKINEESFPLINLKIAVGTKNDARLICNNWKENSSEIYAEIIQLLTRKKE